MKFVLPTGHAQAQFRYSSHWHTHGFQSHERRYINERKNQLRESRMNIRTDSWAFSYLVIERRRKEHGDKRGTSRV